ncbi:hypothetical protein HMPREF2613_03005 [Streptococcus sp. HMSC070B10]|nr:hypothetical protein HMPREF2613_03005 [Streptococcus sp. HMSC070B10]
MFLKINNYIIQSPTDNEDSSFFLSFFEASIYFLGTIYQFTQDTIYSTYENIKKAISKRKSSFSCLFQKFILK